MGSANSGYQLERIANAMEGIHNRLEEISGNLNIIVENMESCTSVTVHGNFLCVTGNISNY